MGRRLGVIRLMVRAWMKRIFSLDTKQILRFAQDDNAEEVWELSERTIQVAEFERWQEEE